MSVSLLYAVSLSNALTNWDDPDYVTLNPIAKLGWAGVPAAFVQVYDGSYYPLTHAVYAMVSALGGSLLLLHAVLLLLFSLTVALVPLALRPFGVPPLAGVGAALLWAAHPLRVDSVVWAANLKDTLGAAFIVTAFALYGAGRKRLAFGLLVGAMLSKSAFFGLAFLFPLLEVKAGRQAVARTWPFVLAGLATAIGAGSLHMTGAGAEGASSWAERLGTAVWTPWWYLARIGFPVDPRAVYDFKLVTPGDWRFFVGLGLWAGLAVLAWRRRALLFPSAAFLFALAPVSGLIPLRFVVADRYTLFPSLAVFAAVCAWLAARWTPRQGATLLAGALVVFVPLNVLRQREWRDSVSLWESNARLSPTLSTVQMNLANAYADAGRFEAARAATEKLLQVQPELPVLSQFVWLSGIVDRVPPEELAARRAALDASAFSQEEVLRQGEWLLTRNFLGTASALLGNSPSVLRSGRGMQLLSAISRRRGDLPQALDYARRAIELHEPRARVELVYALADSGHAEDALHEAELQMPDEFGAALLRGARGYALVKAGRAEEGRRENEAALEAIRRLSGR